MTATYPLGDVPILTVLSEEEANYLLALVSNDIARGATWAEQDNRGLADAIQARLWAILYPSHECDDTAYQAAAMPDECTCSSQDRA